MSTEIAVLRAFLRLSRGRNAASPPTLEDLLTSVDADAGEVHHALASLARAQLVLRSGETARLSLSGLAVAVAAAANARNAKQRRAKTVGPSSRVAAPTARIFPMVARARRHRAA